MEFINFIYAGLADYGRVINRDNTLAFQAIHGNQLHPEKTCNASKSEAFHCRNLLISENSQQSMQGICNWGSVWGVAQNPIRHMYMLYNVSIRSGFVSWPGTPHRLYSWARCLTLIVPVCTQVFKMGTGKSISWGTLWFTRIKSGGGGEE